MKILVYGKRAGENDRPYIAETIQVLQDIGAEIAFDSLLFNALIDLGLDVRDSVSIGDHESLTAFHPDLVITMGGDGTILRAVTMVRDSGYPILGINLGRLGFLASIEKATIKETLYNIDQGKFSIQERGLLRLDCNLPLFNDTPFALNDFTITKRDNSSMIIIKAYMNGSLLNAYWADGIIMATPTGSTGYSLSCGGPIIFPDARGFVITPIAPHNLNVRPIVTPDNAEITFQVEGRAENFMCTLDSRFETITSDHIIKIRKNDFNVRLVQQEGHEFMGTIRQKLLWGLDMRN